ncbi:MAG: molybdate ABC transporter permease subunit [Armatimonadetes bacterium]|nr:molybdate ABC transporter permease subunit [Armatimonadota bacterium]
MNALSVDWAPLALTLRVTLWSTLIATLAGVAVAYAMAVSTFRGRSVVEAVTAAPLVLPPTVLGYYLLLAIGRDSPIGRLYESVIGAPLVFSWQAAVAAASVAAFPYVVRTAKAAFESVEVSLLEAARIDGATRAQQFGLVTLPLARQGVIAGVVLAAARAMGEFGATLMVAGNIPGRTRTMSLAIYDAVQAGRLDVATTLVVALTAVAVVVLILVGRWGGTP